METLAQLNDAAYGTAPDMSRALRSLPGVVLYVARADGRPVGCLGTHDLDGDCCILYVATAPEARGRGLAGRLMSLALHEARERGATTTSLQATKMGYPSTRGSATATSARCRCGSGAEAALGEQSEDDAPGGALQRRRLRAHRARSDSTPAPTATSPAASGDERTLHENVAAYSRWQLRPRALVDVSAATTATTVLGAAVSMPLLVAPVAFQRMAHPDGEAGDGARGGGGRHHDGAVDPRDLDPRRDRRGRARARRRWFQLYCFRDRGVTRALIDQAEEAGFEAIALTVDVPRLGRRERDLRTGFVIPADVTVPSFATAAGKATGGTPADMFSLMDPRVGLGRLRGARLGLQPAGAGEGHHDRGGRRARRSSTARPAWSSRTTAAASSTARRPRSTRCPEVVDAVDGRIEVLVDGGIRRGADVVKALALGARAVLAGRAPLWGLAARGEQGAREVLELLREEIELAMVLIGCASPATLSRSHVARPANARVHTPSPR